MKPFNRITGSLLASGLMLAGTAWAQDLVTYPDKPFGLTLVNINNPIPPVVVTNADKSISITAGGGDTYDNPDSFTFAYQQLTGDFDIKVRVINLFATDPRGQGSPKASLMVRSDLTPGSPNIQINALPTDADPNNPSDTDSTRHGQIESVGRFFPGAGSDDIPGVQAKYGGDTTDNYYSTYPDLWLRIQRQGNRFLTYFANTNPAAGNFGTNGWNLVISTPGGTNFPPTLYVGLSTVAHNNDVNSENIVTSTYAAYGPTEHPSIPTLGGVPVPTNQGPGVYPTASVIAANWQMTLPEDGIGFAAGDTTSPTAIIWNSGGFGSVSRDVLLAINGEETTPGVSTARYQAGALDFLISPRDPIASTNNLGPYTNPLRQRYGSGDPTVPASQAYFPNPVYGFVYSVVARNGADWNDGAPAFHATTYVQLDDGATAKGYDMLSGEFKSAQFYTRITKLVTGPGTDPASNLGNLQRCAISHSTAWFPYQQGWASGYFASVKSDYNPDNTDWAPSQHWHRGNGYGLFSGTAVNGPGSSKYPYQVDVLTWLPLDSTPTYGGLADLHLPGVNSLTDGLLFTIANEEGGNLRGSFANNAPKPDGSGWLVAIRGVEESKDDPTQYAEKNGSDGTSKFSFVYIPYNSQNLNAARVKGSDATAYKSVGEHTLVRLSTGRYALTIPGKTGKDGMLMLQNSGYLSFGGSNVVDTCFLSYEYGATNAPKNSFVIESRYIQSSGGPGNLGDTPLRDCDFNFVWVDFANPLAPPAPAPLAHVNVTTVNGGLSLSWTAPPGFVLQSAAALKGPWTTVPNATSPWTVTYTGAKSFYRVAQP